MGAAFDRVSAAFYMVSAAFDRVSAAFDRVSAAFDRVSAAFDRVNHHDIFYKLCSVGIGGSVLSLLTQFLSNLSQHVMVDGRRSKLVNVASGVPQSSYYFSCTLRSFFPFWKIC